MRLEFTEEEQGFRAEVRAFLQGKLPAHIREKVLNGFELSRDDHVLWQRTLHERGWGGVSWPKQFGGPGWNSVQQYIFEEESALAGAPRLIPFGIKMVAPVIMTFGSTAQQQRYLPKISAGEEWWCQGYSEPGAGSDLASLKTRAVLDGDVYVVNGFPLPDGFLDGLAKRYKKILTVEDGLIGTVDSGLRGVAGYADGGAEAAREPGRHASPWRPAAATAAAGRQRR